MKSKSYQVNAWQKGGSQKDFFYFLGERCSFIPSINLWYDGFCAFESVREASRYLLCVDGRFYFKKYDGTQEFKKDASFLFSKLVQGKLKNISKAANGKHMLNVCSQCFAPGKKRCVLLKKLFCYHPYNLRCVLRDF